MTWRADEDYDYIQTFATGTVWLNDRELSLKEQAAQTKRRKVRFGFQLEDGRKAPPRRSSYMAFIA